MQPIHGSWFLAVENRVERELNLEEVQVPLSYVIDCFIIFDDGYYCFYEEVST